MIIRRDQPPLDPGTTEGMERLLYSDAGGLTQYGAYVETLRPGSGSSEGHWHEEEDEFLYVVSGEATVVEENGEHQLYRGDAACWPAGVANPHRVVNRSGEPCTYLIFGTRMAHDVVHYPESGRVQRDFEDGTWRMDRIEDGSPIKGGRIEQVRPLIQRGPEPNRAP